MNFELIKDFGRIYLTEKSSQKQRYGLYRCICGKELTIRTDSVVNNRISSCGCIGIAKSIEKNTRHGLRYHKLYNTWANMVKRCTNPTNKGYKNYGGREIKVCEEWLTLENFIKDMYPTYKEGLSIDRINVDGNYEPSNCRWATREIQARNTRKIHSHNKSNFRGVCLTPNKKRFVAQIGVNKKKIHIGTFKTDVEAAKAYDEYVIDNNLEHTRNFS